MTGPVPKIRLRGLSKSFGAKQVLDGVDLDIRAGHGMVILGGSGSGKSVTIKCILGLIAPDAGTIEIDGRDILAMPRREREALNDRIGMLFQNGALFDSLPVWENVCFKCSPRSASPAGPRATRPPRCSPQSPRRLGGAISPPPNCRRHAEARRPRPGDRGEPDIISSTSRPRASTPSWGR